MAAKRKTKTPDKEDNYFIVSIDKKKKLFGLLLMILALVILLSIISYSKSDLANLTYESNDIVSPFSRDVETISRTSTTRNLIGIAGAYVSDFFINSTLGYFSVVFPILMFIWGYTVLFNQDKKLAVNFSNFLVIISVILASFFGMLRFELEVFPEMLELSGKVGGFFGQVVGRLLGGVGSTIFFATALFVSFFIAFDINLESIFEKVKHFAVKIFSEKSSAPEPAPIKQTKATSDNLDKISKLKKTDEKEIDDIFDSIKNMESEPVTPAETTIRIIRTDDQEDIVEPNYIEDEIASKEEKPAAKKENKEKDDLADIIPAVDKEVEETLPEQWEENIKYKTPGLDLLAAPDESEDVEIDELELKRNAELLKEKLALFDIQIDDISVTPGPVVTLYEIVPAPGVKISRIVSLENDIALALAARGIRIIAPIPGKSAIGVEIPNANAQLVSARSVISKLADTKAELPLALGKTISGDIYITDLARMPHLLIAGSTGSGKSVGINMLIASLLYAKHPSDIKFAIVDPKKIELSFYQKLNKHYLAISPDIDEEIITTPQNALILLKAVEFEMEKRYDKLAKAHVRNIVDYNKKVSNPKTRPVDTDKIKHHKMPYIVTIIDELADLMMTSGKEVEAPIARLAQLARAVGIHLVVATQRPSVNVITGVIKANFPARIAYQTATRIDSRTILDMKGAEQLLGRGDMLFLPGGMPKPVRVQNAFISTEEVEDLTNYIYTQEGYSKRYFLPSLIEKKDTAGGGSLVDMDPMFEDAAKVIVRHQQGSVSLLQRRLKLGYSRAARIVDQLEEAGIVGPSEGSKAREVIIETEEDLETILRNL